MTAARPAGHDRVEVDGRYHGRDQHGEASFHADDAQRRIEWGSPGDVGATLDAIRLLVGAQV
jgi:hypothetical protein